MSNLTQFRDHARFMAGRDHTPGCPPVRSNPSRPHVFDAYRGLLKWCGNEDAHDEHTWTASSRFSDSEIDWQCHGICGGCITPKERALWTRLADEIDEHLTVDDEPALFEETP